MGCGVLTSALRMDKDRAHKLARLKNLKEPPMAKAKETVITVSTVFAGRQTDRQAFLPT